LSFRTSTGPFMRLSLDAEGAAAVLGATCSPMETWLRALGMDRLGGCPFPSTAWASAASACLSLRGPKSQPDELPVLQVGATVFARWELGSIAPTFFRSAVIIDLSGGAWLM
jgi:hypothetical protein